MEITLSVNLTSVKIIDSFFSVYTFLMFYLQNADIGRETVKRTQLEFTDFGTTSGKYSAPPAF